MAELKTQLPLFSGEVAKFGDWWEKIQGLCFSYGVGDYIAIALACATEDEIPAPNDEQRAKLENAARSELDSRTVTHTDRDAPPDPKRRKTEASTTRKTETALTKKQIAAMVKEAANATASAIAKAGKGTGKPAGKQQPFASAFQGYCNNCGLWGHSAKYCRRSGPAQQAKGGKPTKKGGGKKGNQDAQTLQAQEGTEDVSFQ